MTEWLERLDDLASDMPLFVAVPLKEIGDDLRAGRARPALFSICEAAEALVRFLVVAASCEAVAGHGGVAPDWLGRAAIGALERPTFGTLVDLLGTIAKEANLQASVELRDAWPDIVHMLFAPSKGLPPERSSLVKLRNPLAHGTGIDDNYAKSLLAHWGPLLVQALSSLPWLTKLEVWARESSGVLLLRGCEPIKVSAPDADIAALALGEVTLRRGDRSTPLVPLAYHRGVGDGASLVGQLFMRTGTVGLLYSLFGPAEAMQVEGSAEERTRFEAMFDLGRWRRVADERDFQERGYEGEFEADARSFEARAEVLETIWRTIVDRPRGAVGVLGPAGIGNSCLVARIVIDLRDELVERKQRGRSHELLLAYRFVDRDRGCAPLPFLRWLIERLARATGKDTRIKPNATLENLRDLAFSLVNSAPLQRVVLVLDGLDELARREASFVAQFIERAANSDKLVLVASSRPEGGVTEALERVGAHLPWPDGLPGMSPAELRAMLVAVVPSMARHLVRNEIFNEEVRNAFMDRLVERANGLPLYVSLVVQSIREPGFRLAHLDDPDWLPRNVEAFFDRLVERGALSDRRRAGPLIGCILTLTHEPLSADEIAALYERSLAGPSNDDWDDAPLAEPEGLRELSGEVLADLKGLLRRSEGDAGVVRFRLLHDDLKTYVHRSPQLAVTLEEARRVLRYSAVVPMGDAAAAYLFRHGVQHLIEAIPGNPGKGARKAADLLCSARYQLDRLCHLAPNGGDGGIRDDWMRITQSAPEVLREGGPNEWRRFWMDEGSWFEPGQGRNAAAELVDAALVYQKGTAVAEAFNRVDSSWLDHYARRLVPGSGSRSKSPSMSDAVLRGHDGRVTGTHELSDGRILSWAQDGMLRLWTKHGEPDAVLRGETSAHIHASELSQGRILTWSLTDRLLRLWTSQGTPKSVMDGHTGVVLGARDLADGRILSWAGDCTLRLWTAQGEPEGVLKGHGRPVSGAHELSDGRILSWAWSGERMLRLWTAQGEPEGVMKGHKQSVQGACELSDGRILSWSRDGTLRLWTAQGRPRRILKHGSHVEGACEMSDGRILSWSNYGPPRLWSVQGKLEGVLEGHSSMVYGARELSDGGIISWSNDGTLRMWTAQGEPRRILEGHRSAVIGVRQLTDGRILSWAASGDNTLRLWTAQGEPVVILYGHEDTLKGAREMSDGRILSWSEDGTLRLWTVQGVNKGAPQIHTSRVKGAGELSDGRVLSWSEDGDLRLWTKQGKLRRVLKGHAKPVMGFREISDGRILSWAQDGTLKLWTGKGEPGGKLEGHKGTVYGTRELSDGRILSYTNDGIQRWTAQGQLDDILKGPGPKVPPYGVYELSDGRILSWGMDATLRLWAAQGTSRRVLRGHANSVSGVFELSDGRILSWAEDGTLRLWTGQGKPNSVLEGHGSRVKGAYEMSDGRILSWSWDGTLRLWSEQGKPLGILKGHKRLVLGASDLSDGRILSWGFDRTLRLWSNRGACIGVLAGHERQIMGVHQLSDGRILSWGRRALRLWTARGTLIECLPMLEHVIEVIPKESAVRLIREKQGVVRVYDYYPPGVGLRKF